MKTRRNFLKSLAVLPVAAVGIAFGSKLCLSDTSALEVEVYDDHRKAWVPGQFISNPYQTKYGLWAHVEPVEKMRVYNPPEKHITQGHWCEFQSVSAPEGKGWRFVRKTYGTNKGTRIV